MLNAILFDLDGTLVNTDILHFAIWQELLREQGITIDRAFYDQSMVGHRNEAIVRDVLGHLPQEAGMKLAHRKEALFRERGGQMTRLEGLDELLSWRSHHQIATAVVTNAPRNNAEMMLTALNLSHSFDTIIISEELPQGKPHPLPYQTALKRLSLPPETAIAFEDTPLGIRSAVGAGVVTIGMATTHSPDLLQDAGAEFAIADFRCERLWQWLEARVAS
ncbi:hydrolase [Phormidium willei BDU 130791]|nr:hydrolase [Phormidium willei BDU 130791]